jgi:hypothetical protein
MLITEPTIGVAQETAQKEIKKVLDALPQYAHYDFEPVRLFNEEDDCWVFISSSPQLQKEGCVPGAVFVRVDKTDGHVWSQAETEKYLMERAQRNKT